MQQLPDLLTDTGLARVRRAAYSSLSCDLVQPCNSTVVEVQAAMLRAVLDLGWLNMDVLSQLLPAEAWGVSLQPSCADRGMQLVMPEPVAYWVASAALVVP